MGSVKEGVAWGGRFEGACYLILWLVFDAVKNVESFDGVADAVLQHRLERDVPFFRVVLTPPMTPRTVRQRSHGLAGRIQLTLPQGRIGDFSGAITIRPCAFVLLLRHHGGCDLPIERYV